MTPTVSDFKVTPWRATCAAVVAMTVAGSLSLAEGPPPSSVMVEPIAAVDTRPVREMRRPDFQTSAEAFGVPGFRGDRAHVAAIVVSEAERQGVPVALALAITQTESGFNQAAVGPPTPYGRAVGLMQLLPSTAEGLERGSSRRLRDPHTNARLGVSYIGRALRECGHDHRCAAQRYFAGPNRRLWREKTRRYGDVVTARAARFGGVRYASFSPLSGPGRIEQDPLAFQAWLRR